MKKDRKIEYTCLFFIMCISTVILIPSCYNPFPTATFEFSLGKKIAQADTFFILDPDIDNTFRLALYVKGALHREADLIVIPHRSGIDDLSTISKSTIPIKSSIALNEKYLVDYYGGDIMIILTSKISSAEPIGELKILAKIE